MKRYVRATAIAASTTILKQEEYGEYYIELSQDKEVTSYEVTVYKGSTQLSKNLYPNMNKANARYNALRRKYRQYAVEEDDFSDIDVASIRNNLAKGDDSNFVRQVQRDVDNLVMSSTNSAKIRGAAQQDSAELEKAKNYIDDYCEAEYGSPADFSDLSNVSILYTTDEDDEVDVQVYVDLENYRINYMYDGNIVNSDEYSSLEDMNRDALSVLEWDWLYSECLK